VHSAPGRESPAAIVYGGRAIDESNLRSVEIRGGQESFRDYAPREKVLVFWGRVGRAGELVTYLPPIYFLSYREYID